MEIGKYQPTLSLKPTQFALGVVEIEFKVEEMLKLKKKKLHRLVDETPIPVVLSPWKELCVIDHHHFLFACWHANVEKVRVKVVKDYSDSKMTYHQFWKKMASENYAYLMDQFGDGPRSPLYLPSDVRGMADDPYRSLAWIVRKEGGYEKSEKPFAEFAWAGFFRKHRLLAAQGKRGLKDCVGKAILLAHSKAAKNLPGYLNPKRIEAAVTDSLKQTIYVVKDSKKGAHATKPTIIKTEIPEPEKAKKKKKKKSKKKN